MDNPILTPKESLYRNSVLSGPIFPVIFKTCLPLIIYQCVSLVFAIFDTAIAAFLGEECVSAVAYISQITLLIGAIGNGLSVGCAIIIADYYGAGNYSKMQQCISTFYFLCAIFTSIFCISLPFSSAFLTALGASPSIVIVGNAYFRIDLLSRVVSFYTAIYLVIERIKGNTRRIMFLNIASLTLKLSISLFFVYILHYGLESLAYASLISKIFLLVYGIVTSSGNTIFSFHMHEVCLTKEMLSPILKTSLPAIFEQVSLYAGKIVVNSMSIIYGDLAIGALSISNNLGGIGVAPQMGLQEGCISLLSQNIGAGNRARCKEMFWKILLVILFVTACTFSFVLLFFHQLISLFSSGNSQFAQLIADIFRFELLGFFPLGISSAICALLYASKHTKATFLIGFCRILVLRVPILYYLQHYTNYGSRSLGIVMLISNGGTGIVSIIVAFYIFYFIPLIKKQNNKK